MSVTLAYARADETLEHLESGHHAYRVTRAGLVMGLVASASSTRGTVWYAYRPGPRRSEPWIVAVVADTRKAAAERLVGGRP